jgi:DNA-binding FadR family transcriptional regulator
MRSSLNAQRNKTDRNDARGIAQMMRMGWFRAVHVKSPESQRLRLLLANRRLLKRKLIDLENHIRGALRAFGLMVGTVARGETFTAEDRQFHLTLYQCLNNDALNGLLQLFWSMYDRLDASTLTHSQRLDETAAHHRKILSALKSGDIARAQHQLDAHFYDTSYALEHHNVAS